MECVVFESDHNIAVGIRFRKKNNSVHFEIADAIDYPSSPDSFESDEFNLLGNGQEVKSFEDANILASGSIFLSENPIDFLNGSPNYIIKFNENTFFKNEFESLISIFRENILNNGKLILSGMIPENVADYVETTI